MDPVSAIGLIASVAQLIDLTAKVIGYINDVENAPEEVDEFAEEASALLPLLIRLRRDKRVQTSQASPWLSQVSQLAVSDNGLLMQLQKTMEQLAKRLQPLHGLRKAARAILWTHAKKDVLKALQKVQRLVSMLNLAFTGDLERMAQLIKDDTAAIPAVSDKLDNIKSKIDDQNSLVIEERIRRISQFFVPFNFASKQFDVIAQRQLGTGQWFLNCDSFCRWELTQGTTIWCSGLPGAGKTMIAAIVSEYLQQKYVDDKQIGLSYIYCDYRRQEGQTAVRLLANIWVQLLLQRGPLASEVKRLTDEFVGPVVFPNVNQIVNLLRTEFSPGRFKKAFIVLDALDECPVKVRGTLVHELGKLQPLINVMITSRSLGDDEEAFYGIEKLQIKATDEDLKAYISGRISTDKYLLRNIRRRPDLGVDIPKVIIENANGMFLLARMQMDLLADKYTPRDVQIALQNLPQGANVLKETYDLAVERIKNQDVGARDLAISVIRWVAHAKRPLTSEELRLALAIRPGDAEIDEDGVSTENLLTSFCAGLVIIDFESKIVRFVHYTTQDYFDAMKDTSELFDGASMDITTMCLTYLLFDTFATPMITFEDVEKRVAQNPLLDYTALNFGYHFCDAAVENEKIATESFQDLEEYLLEFLQAQNHCSNAAQVILQRRLIARNITPLRSINEYFSADSIPATGTDLAAYFDLLPILRRSLILGEDNEHPVKSDPSKLDGANRTKLNIGWFGSAIHWAAFGGSAKSIHALLDGNPMTADIDHVNPWGFTTGHAAIANGELETLKLLKSHGADLTISVKNEWNISSLQLAIQEIAAAKGSRKTAISDFVQSCDTKGTMVNARDVYLSSALHSAATCGDVEVFDHVLQHFEEVSGDAIFSGLNAWILDGRIRIHWMQDRFAMTPLHWAAKTSSLSIVQRLLDHRHIQQLLYLEDRQGDTPFRTAARQSSPEMVQAFIDKAYEHNFGRFEAQMLHGLMAVIEEGRPEIADVIIGRLPRQTLAAPRTETLLHRAAKGGFTTSMDYVMDKFADLHFETARDTAGNTPLHVACRAGQLEAARMLLDQDLEIDAQNDYGQTALHLSALNDLDQVTALLLESGASVEIKDVSGATSTLLAIRHRAAHAMRVLASFPIGEVGPLSEEDQAWISTYPWAYRMLRTGPAKTRTWSLEYWPKSAVDIFTSALCLQAKFSRPVAGQAEGVFSTSQLSNRILEMAEYWLCTKATRLEYMEVRWHHKNQPYLQTEPLRGRPNAPVKRINFHIKSHDQGFSQFPESQGNWTWFQAELIRGDAANRSEGPTITRNAFARFGWTAHDIDWRLGQSHREVDIWVSGLLPGDRLLVVPRAMYPGWVNYIEKVEVDVYTTCLSGS